MVRICTLQLATGIFANSVRLVPAEIINLTVALPIPPQRTCSYRQFGGQFNCANYVTAVIIRP